MSKIFEKFTKAKNYILNKGGHFNEKVSLKIVSETNYALCAIDNIQKNEELYLIPHECGLNKYSEKYLNLLSKLGLKNEKDDIYQQYAIMTILLFYGGFEEEKLYTEITDLFSTISKEKMGYYLDENIKKIIKGSQLMYYLDEYKSEIDHFYNFNKSFFEKNNISYKQFTDDFMFLFNRADVHAFNGGEKIACIYPIDFLLNDSLEANCDCQETENYFICYALRDIKKGEEITLDYAKIEPEEETEDNIVLFSFADYYLKDSPRLPRIYFTYRNEEYRFTGSFGFENDVKMLLDDIYEDNNKSISIIEIKNELKKILRDKIDNCERILKNDIIKKNEILFNVMQEEKNFEKKYYDFLEKNYE